VSIDIHALKKSLRPRLKRAQKNLAEFKVRFAKDPFSAFEWAQGYVRSAVELRVFGEVLEAGPKTSADNVREYAIQRIHVLASGGAPQATAFLAGQLHAEEIRAWTDVVDMIDERF